MNNQYPMENELRSFFIKYKLKNNLTYKQISEASGICESTWVEFVNAQRHSIRCQLYIVKLKEDIENGNG